MADKPGYKPPRITSPPWQTGTRLMFAVFLVGAAAALVLRLKELLLPVVLAMLLAYLLHPLIVRLEAVLKIGRTAVVAILFVIIVLLLAGATTGIGLAVTQQIIGLVQDLTQLSAQLPSELQALSQSVIHIGPWTFDLGHANLTPVINSLASAVQPLISQTGVLLAAALSATASTVGLLILVLVISFYFARDFGKLDDAFLGLVPPAYREDFHNLLRDTGRVWQSFLRGQLILALAMGVSSAAIFGALGLHFALGLGLIAGLMEFVPIFGPIIAGLLAILVALFQVGNWWGLSPLVYAGAVLAAAIVLQQLENNVLVPRIIGHSLNLHPLIVLLAALSGGILAGVLGILLAAPTVATLRLWLGYLYRKTVGIESWPSPVLDQHVLAQRRSRLSRLRMWIASRVASRRPHREATEPGQGSGEGEG